jgi:hypothetical protein
MSQWDYFIVAMYNEYQVAMVQCHSRVSCLIYYRTHHANYAEASSPCLNNYMSNSATPVEKADRAKAQSNSYTYVVTCTMSGCAKMSRLPYAQTRACVIDPTSY